METEVVRDEQQARGGFKPGNAYAWKPGQSGSPKGPARGTRHGGRMTPGETEPEWMKFMKQQQQAGGAPAADGGPAGAMPALGAAGV